EENETVKLKYVSTVSTSLDVFKLQWPIPLLGAPLHVEQGLEVLKFKKKKKKRKTVMRRNATSFIPNCTVMNIPHYQISRDCESTGHHSHCELDGIARACAPHSSKQFPAIKIMRVQKARAMSGQEMKDDPNKNTLSVKPIR